MARKRDPDKRRGSPISWCIGTVISVFFWLIFALMVSILIEWIGIYTLWKDQGSHHTTAVFAIELGYANERIANNVFMQTPKNSLALAINKLDEGGVVAHQWLSKLQSNVVMKYLGDVYHVLEELFVSAFFVTKIFILRLFVLVFALPVLLLSAWIACVDGLVERELRKAGNDRESNVIFDFAVNYSYWAIVIMVVCYLANPFPSNPMHFILPGTALFFLFLRTSFSMYKKYM